jgi:hypothetical protein
MSHVMPPSEAGIWSPCGLAAFVLALRQVYQSISRLIYLTNT